MHLVPLVFDDRMRWRGKAFATTSLLSLPLGPATVLEHLAQQLRSLTPEPIIVAPTFQPDAGYTASIDRATSAEHRVISLADLKAGHDFEISDFLLMIQVRFWPTGGFDLSAVRDMHEGYRGATHVVAVGADAEGTREQVECDARGRVKRVQRFYNKMNWPEVAGSSIVYSVVPAKMVSGVSFGSLGELRSALAARGVLSRDVPLVTDVVDATDEAGFLHLHEQALRASPRPDVPLDFSEPAAEVWVSPEARVDASARLIGPVVIHAGAAIGRDALIVGPSLIGRGSTVGAGAQIIQSVLTETTVIDSEEVVRHQLAASDHPVRESSLTEWEASRSPGAPRLLESMWQDGLTDASVPEATRQLQVRLAVKRVMDAMLSAFSLIVLSPLLAVIAVLIKLDSRGPVFFMHHREGLGGKEFPCIKFRTMVAGAHAMQRRLYKQNEVDGPQFKVQRDPRITKLGHFLRATNIDELPQLINVLLGHMSLVGPRPSPFRENQICVPWRRARLSVRPGITGLWQLCRADDRSRGDFHEWIHFDILYVRHFSLWLDFKVLFSTVATLGGRWSVPVSLLIRPSAPQPKPQARPILG